MAVEADPATACVLAASGDTNEMQQDSQPTTNDDPPALEPGEIGNTYLIPPFSCHGLGDLRPVLALLGSGGQNCEEGNGSNANNYLAERGSPYERRVHLGQDIASDYIPTSLESNGGKAPRTPPRFLYIEQQVIPRTPQLNQTGFSSSGAQRTLSKTPSLSILKRGQKSNGDENTPPAITPRRQRSVKFSEEITPVRNVGTPLSGSGNRNKNRVTSNGSDFSSMIVDVEVEEIGVDDPFFRMLLHEFPKERDFLLGTQENCNPEDVVHVFLDNSNLLISFYNCLKAARGISRHQMFVTRPRLSFAHLKLLLERGRPAGGRFIVGSYPLLDSDKEAAKLGYEPNFLEKVVRSSSRVFSSDFTKSPDTNQSQNGNAGTQGVKSRPSEQAVDEILKYKMVRSLRKVKQPGTVVLGTGDGADGEFSESFVEILRDFLEDNWKVEVVCFQSSLSNEFLRKDFEQFGERYKIIFLDDFVEDLVHKECINKVPASDQTRVTPQRHRRQPSGNSSGRGNGSSGKGSRRRRY